MKIICHQFLYEKNSVCLTKDRNTLILNLIFSNNRLIGKRLPLIHVGTEEQAADMLTKTLPTTQFIYLREKVMGIQQLQNHF